MSFNCGLGDGFTFCKSKELSTLSLVDSTTKEDYGKTAFGGIYSIEGNNTLVIQSNSWKQGGVYNVSVKIKLDKYPDSEGRAYDVSVEVKPPKIETKKSEFEVQLAESENSIRLEPLIKPKPNEKVSVSLSD